MHAIDPQVAGDPELIEIRPDERLDTTRLEPYLRAHLPHAGGPFALGQFGGGHANLTYLVRFGDDEYVLRRPPIGPIAPSAHDMRREHRVLSRLYPAFELAPRSFLFCDDLSIVGAEFQVMERRRGIVVRREMPPAHADPATCRRVGEMLIDVLARFHRVESDAVGLGDLGRPEGYVQRQVEGWIARWESAKDRDYPFADELIAWLRAHVPRSLQTTLVHNDYKLDNLLVVAGDPAQPVAVLDWDMCTRGDPLMDLGYLLDYWVEAGDDPAWRGGAGMPTWREGFPTRREAAERYARATGFDLGELHWYEIENLFRTIVILAQIYIRYLRGQTQDARFADFGNRLDILFEKARVRVTSGRLS
ncbi:MAG: phosphotransferase family protein [Candidatus Eremiobacteraeota bacterium]|nr:phosphotransferase family protein [Candidatus Eremiobacteraeota bacterium]